ncbi:MAG: HAMP domain-containing protein [Planctomycetes bacterium]|nr:HAMP domain-containing protein [Planctomycetota bacterium]
MRTARFVAVAAAACALAAVAGLLAARFARPDDPAVRVEHAQEALAAALAAERAKGADLAARVAVAAGAERERRPLFALLAPLETPGWGLAVLRDGAVAAWAGSLPGGVEAWRFEGAEGVAPGPAYDYLWFRAPLDGGHALAVRALRPRVDLFKDLRRPCFPAEEIAASHGVGLSWNGEGERRTLGGGLSAVLDPPVAKRLQADARKGPLEFAGWSGSAALLLVAVFGAVFFLASDAHEAVRHLVLAVAFWGSRAAALALGLPAALAEGPVFDPANYATLRLFLLAGTAGELMLTALCVAGHLALANARGPGKRPPLAAAPAPAGFGAIAWLYSEQLVSVVRDTPLDLLDPAVAVPEGAAAALWASLAAGALACFLAGRLAMAVCRRALEPRLGDRAAAAAALALCAAASLAAFRSPLGLLVAAWLALLLPRRPSLPRTAVGGVLAAALLAWLGLAGQRADDARAGLVRQADGVTRSDAPWRDYAEAAAERVKENLSPQEPTGEALLSTWAATGAAAEGLALGIAVTDGESWWSFSVGMPDWNPAEAGRAENPEPQPLQHGLFFDYTASIDLAPRPARAVATVRVAADDFSHAFLRSAPNPDRFVSFYRGDRPRDWSHLRFFAAPPAMEPGRDLWRAEKSAGEDWEVLYRTQAREGLEPRLWAFARRLEKPGERAVAGLRVVFLFAIWGLAFGLAGALLTRAAGTLPRGWSGRLETRLTLALVAVSALPVSAFGFFARELALQPVAAARERLDEETAAIAFNAIHARRVELSAVDPVTLRSIEELVGRDTFYYYNGVLRAAGQPSLATLEIAPGYIPGPAYRDVLAGRRFHPGSESLGTRMVRMMYVRSPRSGRAVMALPSAPGPEPREPGQATSLAVGASTLLALLLWPLSALLAARISGPVAELTRAAGMVEEGDLSVRVRASAPGDVADLVDAFNRMTEGLERGREALARAERERAWREMARQVAHEIKNPLTPLKLSLQNLRAAWRDRDPEFGRQLEESVELTISQIDLLARIATNFSHFAGRPSRKPENLDVNALLRETIELFRPTAPAVAFVEFLAADLPRVYGDRDELSRAFTNLVKNAVQAMPSGGSLTVTTRTAGGKVVIDVADTGVGIPDELRPRMFEPYFSTKTEGTGLGLGIVRRVVEEMGGTISFTSIPGNGTTMSVNLPAAPSNE